jgi:tartrate-resistant acid phosphatase type 5
MLVLAWLACRQPIVQPSNPVAVRNDTDRPDTGDDAESPSAVAALTGRTDALPKRHDPVRFVALGDAGMGNRTQYEVGGAMARVCAERGCDFALYLGDNFYGPLPLDSDAPQFRDRFERPYSPLWFPFMVVLGNHDYGDVMGDDTLDYSVVEPEIAYTAASDRWTMPGRYYSFVHENVRFIGLDTQSILVGDGDDQADFVDRETRRAEPWKIAFGHHPFISNGFHGNAGAYDGYLPGDPADAVPRGDHLQAFFTDHICGRVDVYFAGHDHNRQWLYPTCGTQFFVSGAAVAAEPRR